MVTVACGGAPDSAPVIPVSPPIVEPSRDAGATASVPIDARAVGSLRFEDPWCKRLEAGGTETEVDCPDALLPEAASGELVVTPPADDVGDDTRGHCFRVFERKLGSRTSRHYWDEGRVRCPPDGPNVELPKQLVLTVGRDRYRLDAESLTCRREVFGNPPYWTKASCPSPLVPKLVGLQPDAPCMYRGVQVNCTTATGAGLPARIIGLSVVAGGTQIVIGRGTANGVVKGMKVLLKGLAGESEITDCNERTCRAVVQATPDQIKNAGGMVEIR